MQSGQCTLSVLASQVTWTSPKKRGYTKQPPNGELIERVFADWKKGELNADIEHVMYSEYPDFETLCKTVAGDKCTESAICAKWGPHILNDLGLVYERPETWRVLGRSLRRAIVLLTVLGKNGMRRGGYYRSDLKKIVGTKSNSATDRVIERLCQLHILRRRGRKGEWGRFKYIRPGYLDALASNLKSDKLWRKELQFWQEADSEHTRRYARELVKRLDRLVPKKKGAFSEGRDFAETCAGILIGYQPPKWYIDILNQFMYLLVFSSNIPLNGPGAEPAPKHGWQGGEEEFYKLFEQTAARLIKKIKSIPKSESWWWDSPFDMGDDDALIVLELPFGDRYNIGLHRPDSLKLNQTFKPSA